MLANLNGALDFYNTQGQGQTLAVVLHYAATLREQLERCGSTPAQPSAAAPDLVQRQVAQQNIADIRRFASQLEHQMAVLLSELDAEAAQHQAAKETLLREMEMAKSRAERANNVIKQQR